MKTSWFRFITETPVLCDTPDDLGGGDDLDILEDLNTDDKDDKDDKEDKSDDEEESDEEAKDEDEEEVDEEETTDEEEETTEDEDEEDENEEDADARITHASDLKKAFPDIFKKFPDVKAALFRDQEYSNLFASPKDAESYVAKGKLLDQIESDLIVDGNPKELLNAVKKDSPESFRKIAFTILPYLAEADKEAYLEVAALPIKQLIRSMVARFPKDSNEHKAALYVHRYYFDNTDVAAKVKVEEGVSTTKSEKELEYEKKIQAIDTREQNSFFESTNTSYVTRLTREFKTAIDGDDRLSDWMKGRIIESGLADIKNQLNNDPRFKRSMEALWSQAKSSGYSNDLKSRIVSTALARAKSLVPKVRAKLIAEALGKKVKAKEDKTDKDNKVRTFKKKDTTNKRPEAKKQVSDLDILRGIG